MGDSILRNAQTIPNEILKSIHESNRKRSLTETDDGKNFFKKFSQSP